MANEVNLHNISISKLNNQLVTHKHSFNVNLKEDKWASDQKNSGRCWIFAMTNLLRKELIQKYKLGENFELSQSFLYYHHMRETFKYRILLLFNCLKYSKDIVDDISIDWNHGLYVTDDVIDLNNKDRYISELLNRPIEDGGQFGMAEILIKKFGILPKEKYPDSYHAKKTGDLNNALRKLFRITYANIEHMTCRKSMKRIVKESITKSEEIIDKLLTKPPNDFEWTFINEDNKEIFIDKTTPLDFFNSHFRDNFNYVSVINDPRIEAEGVTLAKTAGLFIGYTGGVFTNIHVSKERMNFLAKTVIADKQPIWFASDVGMDTNWSKNLLSIGENDICSVLHINNNLTKEARTISHYSVMNHAMLIVGMNLSKDEIKNKVPQEPERWKVENSHGDDSENKGHLTMTNDWFNEHSYQIVVKYDMLNEAEKSRYKNPNIYKIRLPWDPMGAVAKID